MMTIILEIAGTLQLIDNKAHIKRYLETVQQRPAYQLATSQG